jgi:hypothetical protein
MDVLILRPQRFASGRNDVHEGSFAEQTLSQRRYGLDDMFAAVENQENSLVGKECQQPRQRVLCLLEASGCCGDGRNHKRSVLESTEINEADRVAKIGRHAVGDRNSHRGFAHSARSHDADKPPRRDLRAQVVDHFVAANHPLQACGQGRESDAPGRSIGKLAASRRALDWCNKAIAPAGYISDVARAVSTVTERSAEAGNMDPKTGLLDDDVRPNPLDQFPVAYDLSSLLDQGDQDIESTAAQRHRLVPLRQ